MEDELLNLFAHHVDGSIAVMQAEQASASVITTAHSGAPHSKGNALGLVDNYRAGLHDFGQVFSKSRRPKQIVGLGVHRDFRYHFDIRDKVPRLNFFAHGASDGSIDAMTHIRMNGVDYDVNDFSAYLERASQKTPFKIVRLAACNSGDGGINSFAQRLAGRLGLPVKGYQGRIGAYLAENFRKDVTSEYSIHLPNGERLPLNWENTGIWKAYIPAGNKNGWVRSYNSEWFYPDDAFL
jgi:hypothetical protein